MKTHLAHDDCSRAADLVVDKRSCWSHFVCGLWTSALQRGLGMMMVAAAAATAVAPKTSVR
jgi:hypothetical protein